MPTPVVSLTRYGPSLVLLAIMVADCGRYADTDLWGHVFFGNATIRAGHLITRDSYSYSAAGHAWNSLEWLSEVIMASVYNALGVAGLKLMKLTCTAATIVFVAMAENETGAPTIVQFGVLTAVAIALVPQMQFRPQLFTFALMAGLMALLARDNFGRRAPVWLAVPGLALWANLHGGYFIGVVALAIYTGVVALQELVAGRGMGRAARLGAITLAGALATLATPLGIRSWSTVAHTLADPMTRQVIADWRPLMTVVTAGLSEPQSGTVFLVWVLGIFAAMAICCVIAPRGGDLAIVAIAGVMMIAAFMAVRNMALAVIAASVPITRHAGIIAARIATPAGVGAESGRRAASTASAAAHLSWPSQAIIMVLALAVAAESGLFSGKIRAAMNYPDGAVAFMRAHGLRGNILGDFGWGQYLIWHTSPESKVFIDARFDLIYPPQVVTGFINFYYARAGGMRLLDSYPHDFVLIPPSAQVHRAMMGRADWKLIYGDRNAVLLTRAGSAAAQIPAVSIKAVPPPNYFP